MLISTHDEAKVILLMLYVLLMRLFPELVKPEPQTGIVKGVLSYGGQAVFGATVKLMGADGVILATATSDETGYYELPAMALGVYSISAVLTNEDGSWLEAKASVELAATEMVVDLALERITASKTKTPLKLLWSIAVNPLQCPRLGLGACQPN